MRAKFVGGIVATLLMVPAVASAQEADDPCYADPTSPECIDVGGSDETPDDGTGIGGADFCIDEDGNIVEVGSGETVAGGGEAVDGSGEAVDGGDVAVCDTEVAGSGEAATDAAADDEVDVEVLAQVQSTSTDTLPVTGSDLLIALGGAGLLAAGAALVLASRRRGASA